MSLYRVFATGTKSRQFIKFDDKFYENVANVLAQETVEQDHYESLYLYNEEHAEQFNKTKSVAGIKGLKTDRLVFDFDSTDVEKARQDACSLVDRLVQEFQHEDYVRIFYSGNKGFHVEVHLKGEFLSRKQFSNIVDNLAGDLETFDTSIRDEQRLFRYPFTLNKKTGRYKIPLTRDQLNSMMVFQIEEAAAQPSDDRFNLAETWNTTPLTPKLKKLMTTTPEKTAEPISNVEDTPLDTPDLTRIPDHLTPAKYVLEQGFFEVGERNEACMILASTYRYLGMGKEHAYNAIKATLRLRSRRLGADDYDKGELWQTVMATVYSPTWKGGTYSEEEGLLAKTIAKYKLNKLKAADAGLVSLGEVSSFYKNFAENIDKNTIKLGIAELDEKVRVTTSMFVCLLAAPGAGKTTVGFNLLNSISNNGEKSIFFSLDMAIPQVYQRLIQKHTGHKEKTIEHNYKNNVVEEIEKYQNALSEEYKNVKFCFRSGMTTEHIKQAIVSERDRTGILPKLVLIDYLECIQGPFSDSNANKALIATQLKDIANELGICVFLLVQPAKMTGDPSEELKSYTQIKGSSVLGEAATIVFTLHRPGFSPDHPENDRFATIKVVKNRMGTLSSTDLGWEGLTGRIFALDGQGKAELEALKKELADAKAAEKSSGDMF